MLRHWVSALGLVGLTSRTMVVAEGTAPCSNSTSFGPTSTLKRVAPVTLPPGRFRLATNPICTGSAIVVKTMGIVPVAAFAARTAGVVVAAITATSRRTRSTAIDGHRRQSIVLILCPAGFDPGVLAVFVTGLAQPFGKRVKEPRLAAWVAC